MVYALNSKPGCFTGFCQVKTPGRIFDILDFLAAQALPGPNSFVTCVVQHYGLSGPVQFLVMEKKTALAQIPNLHFGRQAVANLPRPQTWISTKLADATKATIQL